MGLFAGGQRVSHDGYEFMGQLYKQRVVDWLNGVPVYAYLVYTAVKLPVLTVIAFLIGLPLLFRRRLGDGRYFILFWLYLWMIAFSLPGGKFTRYYTTVLPAVLITAAIGIQFVGRWLAARGAGIGFAAGLRHYVPACLAVIVIVASVLNSIQASPHFRLYTNAFGGGVSWAGYYFPHDEFYDASMRDVIGEIATRARPGARVVSERPTLAAYYAQRAQRPDLICVSLSDPDALKQLTAGDFVIIARGRRYFSNDALINALHDHSTPLLQFSLGPSPSAILYQLDQQSSALLRL